MDPRMGPQELSTAGVGIRPGLDPETMHRRPAWHTGHGPMSTLVMPNKRVTIGFVVSSVEGLGSCGRRRWPNREGLSSRKRGKGRDRIQDLC